MRIVFKQLIVTDIKEKVSKKVVFQPERNLLTSDSNGKGKSTIMKSLYHSMGANAVFDDNIDKKAMIFDIKFSFGENEYRIVRFVDQYLVYKDENLEINCKYGNINELSEYYKKEFGMYVYLKNRMGGLPIAPPAYSFIPYYLDQDCSWKKEQMPFDNLGQYEKPSKNDLYYYHLAVYSDEYTEAKSQFKTQQMLCENIKNEIVSAQKTYGQLKDQISTEDACIDEAEIGIIISNLSMKINDKFTLFNRLKNEVFVLENEKVECLCQINSIDKGIKDINNHVGKNNTKEVMCPQCGTKFDIDIEDDIKKIYNKTFLQNRKSFYLLQVDEIDKKIEGKKYDLKQVLKDINEMEQSLSENKANYDSYMKRKVSDGIFHDLLIKIGDLNIKLGKEQEKLEELQSFLDAFENKTTKINEAFKASYIGNLVQLNVKKFNSDKIKAFNKLAIGGSQYVRSTLAFFYSFLELKKSFNKDKFNCPLVIDSPREGEQDDMNSKNIIDYIFGKYDGEDQLIVASVNGDRYIGEDANRNAINIIKLQNEDNQVMTKEGYTENIEDINQVKSYFGLSISENI